jgi:hypothetical protein
MRQVQDYPYATHLDIRFAPLDLVDVPALVAACIPAPIGPLLTTATIVPADMPVSFQPVDAEQIQWEPTVSFGLRADQIAAFFSPMPTGVAALDKSIELNRAFGTPGIVNLNFAENGQTVSALKNVVYWPRLNYAGEQPNRNPTLGDPADPTVPKIRFYSHRDETTGNPDQPLPDDAPPTLSLSAMDRLYVEPNYPNAVDSYQILVQKPGTTEYEPRVVDRELIRFQFYATAGKFDPEMQFSELDPALSGGSTLHTDAEYVLPKLTDMPAGGVVVIWLVTHDERAGTDWASRPINVVP